MSFRRTILYLFLAGCHFATTASPIRIFAKATDTCPNPPIPSIVFHPGRSSLTTTAKDVLRRAVCLTNGCDSCMLRMIVEGRIVCGPRAKTNVILWDRAIHTTDFLCNTLHVSRDRVIWTFQDEGDQDRMTFEWTSRSEYPANPAPHLNLTAPRPNLPKSDTITVFFDLNRSSLSPGSDSIIDASFRHARASQHLEIMGYCDTTGTAAYNNQLSIDRTRTVHDYLRLHWIDSTSIVHLTGYGANYPAGSNDTEAGRALNRRVSVIISDPGPVDANRPPPQQPAAPAESRSVYKAITDTNTRIGASIVLKDVVFYGGRRNPLPISYGALGELLKAMKENDNLRIRIEGHVCCIPDSTDGPDLETGVWDLSVQRAKVVADYLVQHGIPKDHMTYIGLGGSGKLYPEEIGAAQQAANRRVEIRIIAK